MLTQGLFRLLLLLPIIPTGSVFMRVEVDPGPHWEVLFGQSGGSDGPVGDEILDGTAGLGDLLLGLVGLELVGAWAGLWGLVGVVIVLELSLLILLPILVVELLILAFLSPHLLAYRIILIHLLFQHLL